MSVQITINGENAKEALFELFGLSEGLLGRPEVPVFEPPVEKVGKPPVVEAPKTRKRATKAEAPAPEIVEEYKQPWVNEAPEVLEPATLEEIHELVDQQEAIYAEAEAIYDAAEDEDPEPFDTVMNEDPFVTDNPPVFITVEEVRATMLQLSRKGLKDTAKQILDACGVTQLSLIPPARYAEVMQAAKVALAEKAAEEAAKA